VDVRQTGGSPLLADGLQRGRRAHLLLFDCIAGEDAQAGLRE